jgi:multiple sugar transport system ATP-binding protein
VAGCRLDLAAYSLSGPRPAHGQSVVLGVRPEHIRIGDRARLDGRVSLVERMGNAQVVWIDWCGNLVSCLSHDAREFTPDEVVRFDIDATRISLFDAASELRL